MVNPALTILFDLFLIASGLAVLAGMALEYRASRRASIGGRTVSFRARCGRPVSASRARSRAVVGRSRRRLAA